MIAEFIVERTFEPIGIDAAVSIEPLSHYSNDSANAEWLAMCRADETEGEFTPAQIQIRADFPRRAFCLYVNGEAVGASSQYKAVYLAKQFLLGELL